MHQPLPRVTHLVSVRSAALILEACNLCCAVCNSPAGKSIKLLRLPAAVSTGVPAGIVSTQKTEVAVLTPPVNTSEQPDPQPATNVGQEAPVAVTLPDWPALVAAKVGVSPGGFFW